VCDGTEVCTAGDCACRPGFTAIGGTCVDTQIDPEKCGPGLVACGGATPLCEAGVCVAECSGGLEQCGDGCVDLQQSPIHCGDCDQPCATGQVCLDGECFDYTVSGAASCDEFPCPTDQRCCRYPADGPAVCLESDAPHCPT